MLTLPLLMSFCSRSLSTCPQGLTGGASDIVRWQSTCCVLLLFWLVVVCCRVVVCAGMTNAPVTSYVSSLYQMRAIFTKWNLSATCKTLVKKLTTYLRCLFFDNSDTLSTKTTNSYVGPYNISTLSIFLQHRYKFGLWNMYTTCTELAGKLVKFCTNLHTLIFLGFK